MNARALREVMLYEGASEIGRQVSAAWIVVETGPLSFAAVG